MPAYTYKEVEHEEKPKDPEVFGQSADSITSQPPPYEDIAVNFQPEAKSSRPRQRINSGDLACAIDYGHEEDKTPSEDFNLFSSCIRTHSTLTDFYRSRKAKICRGFYAFLAMAYVAYFVASMVLCQTQGFRDPTPLIVLTCVVVVVITLGFIEGHFGERIQTTVIQPMENFFNGKKGMVNIVKGLFLLCVLVAIVVIIGTSVWVRPHNATSMLGIIVLLLMMLLFSAHPTKVNWRPVAGGLLLQFFFASLILKLSVGYTAFKFLGDKIQIFLSFTNTGTEFVFGEKYTDHFFAMKVLPVIVFFSCAISVLYYSGVMQVVIGKIAWLMRVTLGTTAAESVCAAGNIFVGLTEAPILIRPYLGVMTKSELHAVITCGFATIAGGVLAAYIEFGVPAEHLLCASVMNAPGALAVSKLLYPETEESKLKVLPSGRQELTPEQIEEGLDPEDVFIKPEQPKEKNVIEAAAGGASASIKLVANIAANLIAFLAMLTCVNAILAWFGSFVGITNFSFQMICSYLLMPVAYLMGVDWNDAGVVGELIGVKTFLNEFIAYSELATYIKNRELCLVGTSMSVRSEVIATYALCGFSNLGSIGIMLGALGPMAPKRKGDIATVVMRALLGGIVVCLLTASIAGLLVTEFPAPPSCLMQNITSSILPGNTTAETVLNVTLSGLTDLPTVYNTSLPAL
ncbi:solute carrier family 28 member 3-like [Mizuhopecten yessoensis]|uniref:Sodium/nucleoside cotransporter n=1 Tax=Mizuhopecten yessoensis TaxID=6573 RepID=A0A210PS65_MIZYE|nr:solute carrier family 28 member 3-like [Mizuhopecten yessoensis]OWF39347.1 Solute carrier family 28 member 3 [Mizuhopecten yessoensis]